MNLGPETIALPGGLQPFMFHTATGRLVVTAQLQPDDIHHFPGIWATVVSDDGGATWQRKTFDNVPGGSPFHEGAGASLDDGTLVLYEWSARGPQPDGAWIARRWESRDDFDTLEGPFDTPIDIPQARGGFDDMNKPVPEFFLHRSLLVMPDGGLLMCAYGWFHGDDTPSAYMKRMCRFRNFLMRSDDGGKTFRYLATMACDPAVGEEGFNEPVVAALGDRLIALHRTGSNKAQQHNPLYINESHDGGATWTTPRPTNLETVDPDLIALADGTLVATFGYRTALSRAVPHDQLGDVGEGHGNYIAFSRDGGATWSDPQALTQGPSTCYTAVREVSPGKLLVVYDIGDHWARTYRGYENQPRAIAARTIDLH